MMTRGVAGMQSEQRHAGRTLRLCAALALLPMLGGCIAAVAAAVPALTAVGVISQRQRVRAATPRPSVVVERARDVPAAEAASVIVAGDLPPPDSAMPNLAAPATLGISTALAPELPPAWQSFIDYAATQAVGLSGTGVADSAILTSEGASTAMPRRRRCPERTPAVLIDLDDGRSEFAGTEMQVSAPALATALAQLRQAGVVVLWISRASSSRVGEIGAALEAAGLDPGGRDPLLLVRQAEERKQVLREEAHRDVCIVAIAGDERADFDELFEYLRNPATGGMLDQLIGRGWFLVPHPLAGDPD